MQWLAGSGRGCLWGTESLDVLFSYLVLDGVDLELAFDLLIWARGTGDSSFGLYEWIWAVEMSLEGRSSVDFADSISRVTRSIEMRKVWQKEYSVPN